MSFGAHESLPTATLVVTMVVRVFLLRHTKKLMAEFILLLTRDEAVCVCVCVRYMFMISIFLTLCSLDKPFFPLFLF